MDIETLRIALLSLRGCTEDTPFTDDIVVFRVKGKIFACIDIARPDRVVLKSAPQHTDELLAHFSSVVPAKYWNKRNWIEVLFGGDVTDDQLLSMARLAYAIVLGGFTKKAQIAFFREGLASDTFFYHTNTCSSTMEQAWAVGDAACASGAHTMACVHSDLQKHGRGQTGTHWESQNGKNLTFTMAVSPTCLKPENSFLLLQTVAVALHKTISQLLLANKELLTIKWPNDIYYADKKLCGTLIQNNISGHTFRLSAIGIGLNVNQTVFPTWVPNPVSLAEILGAEISRFVLLEDFLRHFGNLYADLKNTITEAPQSATSTLHRYYMRHLFRSHGTYTWRDADTTFQASIADVLPTGSLVLRLPDGSQRTYAFKEVEYVF